MLTIRYYWKLKTFFKFIMTLDFYDDIDTETTSDFLVN